MKKSLFLLSIAGTTFSGYLSGVKLFSKTCAFGETCPNFLGYPACYYGFVLFLLLTIFSALLLWGKGRERSTLKKLVLVSGAGVVFAGYYSSLELPLLLANGFSAYTFGVPTCILGFIFFVAIFIVASLARKRV